MKDVIRSRSHHVKLDQHRNPAMQLIKEHSSTRRLKKNDKKTCQLNSSIVHFLNGDYYSQEYFLSVGDTLHDISMDHIGL